MEKEAMNVGVEDEEMHLPSEYYSGLYTQMPEEGKQRRRRRRKEKGEGAGLGPKKKKLSAEQVSFLEENFGSEHKLESERKDRLAAELGLDPRTVAIWFQNRRARWKNKQLEEEYLKLKMTHESVVVEKCRLEAEMLKLREQLSEAEEEVKKLKEEGEIRSSTSPSSSSFSMDPHQSLLGEFENAKLLYMLENNYINGLEWATLCGF